MFAVFAAAMSLAATARGATTTFNAQIQFSVQACNGHTIQLSGNLLGVLTTAVNPAGGFVFATHSQPQGISGFDVQTGTKYLATGLTRDMTIFTPSSTVTFTAINRFHIQGTAGADSFYVSSTFHFTVLADGTVTAFVDNFSATC